MIMRSHITRRCAQSVRPCHSIPSASLCRVAPLPLPLPLSRRSLFTWTSSITPPLPHSSACPILHRTLHTASSPLLSNSAPKPEYDAPLPKLQEVALDITELKIDPSVVKRLSMLTSKTGRPQHLRVMVDQGGCSGLEYKFELETEEEPEEEDVVIPFDGGVSVRVDRDSWLWLRGSKVEWVEEVARAAFIVTANPNATQACGCKSSFAPKQDPRKM